MAEAVPGDIPAALDTVRERPGGRSARIRIEVLNAAREELIDNGYAGLSHRAVALRAGVDPATVYRRWPTRPRLATDALLDIASGAVPMPATDSIETDLRAFLTDVVAALSDRRWLRLFHALSAAGAEDQDGIAETVRSFWEQRFAGAGEMIRRAVERGELPAGVDARALIEQAVAPTYFRALVTGEGFDSDFVERCAAAALAAARADQPAPSAGHSQPPR